jgi:hypothetical protein
VTARSFWPPAEATQVDYETLRAHLLEHGRLPDGLAAARFARRGVAGLIGWPAAEPVFVAELLGAAHPAWTPHADPRMSVLAAGYHLPDAAAVGRRRRSARQEVVRDEGGDYAWCRLSGRPNAAPSVAPPRRDQVSAAGMS